MKINPNLSIEQALKKAGVRFVATSGYRSPKRQRELGLTTRNSMHSQRRKDGSAWALDIIPDFKNGATWDTLRQELAQPALQEYFMANHMGALDETIPSVKKRTGATGNHYHVGKVRTDNGEGASVYMHWVNEFYPKNKVYTMGNPDFKYTPGKVSAGSSYTQRATSGSGQSQTYSPEDMEGFVGALFNSPQESRDKKLPLIEVINSDGSTVATKEAETQGGINNIIVNTKKMFADKKQPEPEFAQPSQAPQTPVLAEKQQEPSLMDNMYKTDLLTYFQNLDNQYAQEEEPISLFADNNQFGRGGKINKEANNKAMWEKGKPIYKRLISAGIKPIVAMGIIGNMALESGFNHNIVSKSGSFSGLTQNSKEIRKYIVDNYGGYTLNNQIQYILDGLNSSLNTSSSIGKQLQSRFNNYTKKMKGIKSPETAAALWESSYEKSGGQSLKTRKDYARYFWDNIGDLNKHYKPVKSNGNSAYEPLIFNPTDINEEEIKRFIDTTTSKVAESYANTYPYPWEIKQPDFTTPSESIYYNPEPINYTTVPSLPQEIQQAPVGQDIINQMYNTSVLNDLLASNTAAYGGNLFDSGSYMPTGNEDDFSDFMQHYGYRWSSPEETNLNGLKANPDSNKYLVDATNQKALASKYIQNQYNSGAWRAGLNPKVTNTEKELLNPALFNLSTPKVSYENQLPYQEYGDPMVTAVNDVRKKNLDKVANRLSPGAGFFVGLPAAAIGAGIGAASLGSGIAALNAAYPTLFPDLIASTIGGEAVNAASQFMGYNSWGDMLKKQWNLPGPEWFWDLSNLGYLEGKPVELGIRAGADLVNRGINTVIRPINTYLLAREMNNLSKGAAVNSDFIPLESFNRFKVGDVEVNNPGLNYRQVSPAAGEDFKKPITKHLQGEEAVKMFKEYGGTPLPEGSINAEQILKYVPEARERYGLVGNTSITDKEIAEALYKHVNELGEGTAAVNAQGEPQLLFRGDTNRYTELKDAWTPQRLLEGRGTMDNALGRLFLGEYPGTAGDRFDAVGASRYLHGQYLLDSDWVHRLSATGYNTLSSGELGYQMFFGPNPWNRGRGTYFGFIKDKSTPEAPNDLNAFVVRTPAVRDITQEMGVPDFGWQALLETRAKENPTEAILRSWEDNGKPKNLTQYKWDKSGENVIDKNGNILSDTKFADDKGFRVIEAEQYQKIVEDAQRLNQGLLKSDAGAKLRSEHKAYNYFALPNFNRLNAKHILPFDLRIPRNWKDPNIYKSLLPFGTIGSSLYFLNEANQKALSGNLYADGKKLQQSFRPAIKQPIGTIKSSAKKYPKYIVALEILKGVRLDNKNDPVAFALNYYKSPGFQERFRKYTPKYIPKGMQSYTDPLRLNAIEYGGVPEIGTYIRPTKTIFIDQLLPTRFGVTYDDILSHELGHAISDAIYTNEKGSTRDAPFSEYTRASYADIYPVFRENRQFKEFLKTTPNPNHYKIRASIDSVPHDASPEESYADLISLRYDLYKNGIFDSTKAGQVFTKDLLDKYKEEVLKNRELQRLNSEHPNEKINQERLFDNFTDDQIIQMLNEVAYNPTIPNSNSVNYADNGGILKKLYGEPIWLDDGSIFGPILPNITVTSSTKKKKK